LAVFERLARPGPIAPRLRGAGHSASSQTRSSPSAGPSVTPVSRRSVKVRHNIRNSVTQSTQPTPIPSTYRTAARGSGRQRAFPARAKFDSPWAPPARQLEPATGPATPAPSEPVSNSYVIPLTRPPDAYPFQQDPQAPWTRLGRSRSCRKAPQAPGRTWSCQ